VILKEPIAKISVESLIFRLLLTTMMVGVLLEVFRSRDLSWDLGKRFSGGVFSYLGMFTFPFSADD
jgi:hypothetical protein